MVYGLNSDSNVATVGASNVAGRGHIIGGRGIITFPAETDFYHTLSLGVDYKQFDEDLSQAGTQSAFPITYYPLSATYSATWQGQGALTQLNGGVTGHLRGLGSKPSEFDAKRFKSGGDFFYFRGDLAHTQDLPGSAQLFAKVQAQAANQPLVVSEQFSGGGLDTVRGYREAEVLGDGGAIGSVELRSPSIASWLGQEAWINEWRFHLFGEGGRLSLHDPLPEQQSIFDLASFGLGTRFRLVDAFNGSFDLAIPAVSQNPTRAYSPQLKFRMWGEF
jgi:hemolysin activation/secretion protein